MTMSDTPSTSYRPSTLELLLAESTVLTTPSAERIRALYAFTSKQKLSNPAGYDKNYRWWVDTIEEALREGLLGAEDGLDRLILDGEEQYLVYRLEWLDGKTGAKLRPKGLGGVLASETRIQPPVLYSLPTFLSALHPVKQPPSLASRFVARPLWWAVSKVNPFGGSGEEDVETEERSWKRIAKTEWVHLDLVEEASSNFSSHIRANPPVTHSATLLTPNLLIQRYGDVLLPSKLKRNKGKGVDLSLRDARVLLKYLQRDKHLLVGDTSGEVCKIVLDTAEYASASITEADKGTVAILSTLDKLDRQIEEVSKEITAAQTKAAHHLNLKQKNVALSYLRSKKQLETVLDKRVGAAEQLRSVLRGIENAHGNVEIMRAYETSTATLKDVLSHPSLQRDHIDTTMDALAETMADQQEIDDAIQSGGQLAVSASGFEADEDELARELEGLIKEEEEDFKENVRAKEAQDQESELSQRMAALKPTSESPSPSEASERAKSTILQEEQTPGADKAWEAVYEEAQARRAAEAARAQEGRLKKEAKVYEAA
ncbi:hypothetical protein NliqN6_0962 [Naganishia liquefaciens]|uniref:Uncharacterized protein n=1 Tax=Naganishia liquefaciens TaxID=104408 RepID=A0A8H3TNZ2_9TREE|nr:hypothetical protein NliqN6_0962 [Naganishia liquefaciens]